MAFGPVAVEESFVRKKVVKILRLRHWALMMVEKSCFL